MAFRFTERYPLRRRSADLRITIIFVIIIVIFVFIINVIVVIVIVVIIIIIVIVVVFVIIIKITFSSNLIGSFRTLFFPNLLTESFIGYYPITTLCYRQLLSDN